MILFITIAVSHQVVVYRMNLIIIVSFGFTFEIPALDFFKIIILELFFANCRVCRFWAHYTLR